MTFSSTSKNVVCGIIDFCILDGRLYVLVQIKIDGKLDKEKWIDYSNAFNDQEKVKSGAHL